jgi:glyoxylase-like metal-dependent hydrolase (beta-lactamase superfamily II)
MTKLMLGTALALALTGCGQPQTTENEAVAQANAGLAEAAAPAAKLSIVRLDCGGVQVADFSKSFSDQQIYPHGPKRLTDSCYVITHGDQHLLWDTGLPAAMKGKPQKGDQGMTPELSTTLVEQLAKLGLSPESIDVVGISHDHFDHTGQAAAFPNARLVIGKADFEHSAGKGDPFGPWRSSGASVTAQDGDIDIFGDGSVTALALPGHTPGHHALLVKLASGSVLLTGDLYHATEAREKRGVPPFNTSREQTLASMDKFEALAKQLGAKVIIQHEPADIAKLPPFPKAAE